MQRIYDTNKHTCDMRWDNNRNTEDLFLPKIPAEDKENANKTRYAHKKKMPEIIAAVK